MSATDPTRPVRDQIAAIILRETNAARYRPIRPETAAEAVLALPVVAEAFAALAERDALRATVDRVRAAASGMHNHPGMEVGSHADEGCLPCRFVRALDGATPAAQRPPDDHAALIEDPHQVPAAASRWLAAQGVPLTEDPR